MLKRERLKKAVIAFVMLIAAAFVTVYIKDVTDAANPEKNLPIISVSTGYNPPYVVRAGYTWKFGFKTVMSPFVDVTDVPLMVTDAYPETPIAITFSQPGYTLHVYESSVLDDDGFYLINDYNTPKAEGTYIYRIDAEFPDGEIVYYFEIEVKNGNLMS